MIDVVSVFGGTSQELKIKMLQLPILGLMLFALQGESHTHAPPVHANLSCTETETQCLFGCCPYKDAVCCIDGYECCEQGKVCIPIVGICVGIETKPGQDDGLVSTQTVPVRNMATACPSDSTTCGPDSCCLMPNANCCEDGEHCCANGYRCDVPNKRCVKITGYDYYSVNDVSEPRRGAAPLVRAQSKTVAKVPHKSCPGGSRTCPSYTSCCLNDDGAWGCCPNPTLGTYSNGGECCNTIFGYMCCPDDYPTCTIFGCTK